MGESVEKIEQWLLKDEEGGQGGEWEQQLMVMGSLQERGKGSVVKLDCGDGCPTW